jgi:hypothetical protein
VTTAVATAHALILSVSHFLRLSPLRLRRLT